MHQPLGLSQFGKGLGESTLPPLKRSDHAMADQHADIATGARLGDPRAQAHTALLRLQP